MTLTAILLLLCSAFTHAGWNLLGKKEHPSAAFFLLANFFGTLYLLPVIFCYWDKIMLFPPLVWWLLTLTGFFLAIYFWGLSGAYRAGDLSLAYPVARSSPVIVVTFVTLVLGEGHLIGRWAIVGILLVVGGCFLLPLKNFRDRGWRHYPTLCYLLALLAALGTAGYTIVDDRALAILRSLPGQAFTPAQAAISYLLFLSVSATLWLGLIVLLAPGQRRLLKKTAVSSRKPAALTGLGIHFTYGLVLTSMAYVTNVSYVAAFRQLSVVIGAILGFTILKEPAYPPKLLGVIIIFAGLVMVALG